MVAPDEPVADEEQLLRTSFAPHHVVNGKAIVTAIASQDIQNRGFSVDREALVDESAVRERAEKQMSNDPENRREAWVSSFNCGAVRSAHSVADKQPGFVVNNEPIAEGEVQNLAHSGIYSAAPRSRSMIKALKEVLLPYLNENLRPMDEYFAQAQTKSD